MWLIAGEKGQGLLRFAVILVLVALVVVLMAAFVGPALGEMVAEILEGVW